MRVVEDIGFLNEILVDVDHKVYYFKKSMKSYRNYDAHIICCEITDNNHFVCYWKEIINSIAKNIQAKVTQKIESYNIYVLFFNPNAEEDLSFLIEQDRYSSRKIVIKDRLPTELDKLSSLVNTRLFELNIEKSKDSTGDISQYLSDNGEELLVNVGSLKGKIQSVKTDDIHKILKSLNIDSEECDE